MRICLYTGSALPKLGGQEAVVDSLARQFQTLGHDVTVMAPRPRLPLRPRDDELPYRVLRHPRFFSTARGVGLYRYFLGRVNRQCSFDVVHCHDVYPTGYVASLALRSTKIPLILTSHGGDIRPGNARIIKSGLRSRFNAAIKSAAALISIGNFTRDAFLQLDADPVKIHDIPNGVDLVPFAAEVERPGELDPAVQPGNYLLFLGRLSDRKGVDTLIRALAATTSRVRAAVAGSGEQRAELEALARSLKVADRIHFVGRVAGATKSWLLQNAIAIAMPSRGWEAFPLTVLESYAAGRPVIGSAIPGMIDVIRDGETGLLVPPDSPSDFAKAVDRVVSDRDWTEKAGQTARAAVSGYGWESIAARHVALYEAVIRGQAD